MYIYHGKNNCSCSLAKPWCLKHNFFSAAFIVFDKQSETPRSKGFGFVTFYDSNNADDCRKALDGTVSSVKSYQNLIL